MGIKESNLPIAESLGSGDKLRIVTSEGESKQIGADSVGMVAHLTRQWNPDISQLEWVCDKTYEEMQAYVYEGGADILLQLDGSNGAKADMYNLYLSQYSANGMTGTLVFTGVNATSNSDSASMQVRWAIFPPDGRIIVPDFKTVSLT